jgi:hypothetical protein
MKFFQPRELELLEKRPAILTSIIQTDVEKQWALRLLHGQPIICRSEKKWNKFNFRNKKKEGFLEFSF